jgi:hypothetical protein
MLGPISNMENPNEVLVWGRRNVCKEKVTTSPKISPTVWRWHLHYCYQSVHWKHGMKVIKYGMIEVDFSSQVEKSDGSREEKVIILQENPVLI